MCMLRCWCAGWAYGPGTDVHPDQMHQFLTCMLNMCISFPIFQMFILCTPQQCIRNWCTHWVSRTYGVSIFIDYCTAPRDTEKDERRGKRHLTDKREWGQQLFSPRLLRALKARARRVVLIKPPPPPPPPTHSPCRILAIFRDLGQKQGWPPFRGLKVLQLNLDSFCDHVRKTFRSRDRFLTFPQEMVKIKEPADIWTEHRYFDKSCQYNSRYSTGETPPI